MKITLAGQEILLHCAGLALLPQAGMALVSDLHLEKGSHFAQRGWFLPPYDSHATLLRLLRVCAEEKVRRLVILGDCFHDAEGFSRLDSAARGLFGQLLDFQPVWIRGNHDGDFVPDGFEAFDTLALGDLILRHEAKPGAVNEISGHFHPKVEITHKGAQLERRCFIEDGYKLILPAFGAYAGGLAVTDPAIRRLMSAAPRVHALGEKNVFSFPLRGRGVRA